MLRRIIITAVLFLLAGRILSAQTDSIASYLIRANAHYGVILPEYGFQNYLAEDYCRGFEINIAKQTSGKNIWQRLYRYPSFGLSFFYSTMGNPEVFGNQFTIYPYYALHIIERKKFSFGYQLGVGASYATKKFGFDSNYENVAIGSHLNIHFHTEFTLRAQLYKNLFLNAGLAFNHISNANLSEPNVGLNFCTLYSGLSYAVGKNQPRITEPVGAYPKDHLFSVMICGGMKHTRTFESFQYPAFSVSFDYRYRPKYKFAFGGGADFFYDSSTEVQMKRLGKNFKSTYAYTSGLHISQEFMYDRFSLIVQEGLYIGLTEKLNGYKMYNRAILRYRFLPHWFVNVSMKSHLVILDFPELGVGYSWQ